MYIKHHEIMEETGVDVGRCLAMSHAAQTCSPYTPLRCRLERPCQFSERLDGTWTKEQLYNAVYEDILNNIQKLL